MATLSSLLPKPRQQATQSAPSQSTAQYEKKLNQLVTTTNKRIPPYGQRAGYRPRVPEDFGNGGAFPEIHIAQYPLNMGRTNVEQTEKSGGALTLQVDAEGNVKYDAIVRQGHSDDRIIHSSLKDLVPLKERKDVDVEKIAMDRPSEEVVMSVAEKTKAALEKIVNTKIAAAQPNNVVRATGGTNKDPTYIRYTPAANLANDNFNAGAKQRIIRMTQKDPRGPPSPPAPVMHSPPRKLTAKEQAEWVIPPCISNWKNTKGYTIPLDKRLAADGRGLQEITINDNFAKFSEALYAADRHAREEVRQRNLMQQKLAQKQKDAEEQKLRELAQKAREERSGLKTSASTSAAVPPSNANRPTAASLMPDYDSSDDSDASSRSKNASESESEDDGRGRRPSSRRDTDDENDEGARERDRLRRERQKKREREMRMSRMGTEAKAKHLAREQGRDISEKIALGLAKPTMSKESMFDARLFNQSEGIGSGFKDDESYSLYDKPLFNQTSSSIYKFRGNQDDSDIFGSTDAEDLEKAIKQDKFGVRKGFAGAEGGVGGSSGPVEFEKEVLGASAAPKEDVFGLDTFLNKAKKGKRKATSDDEDEGVDRKGKRRA
ncbi:SKIP/SNW domain-containing protein [Dichotomocladium elegans]|nr:SKIP/SNW domain-containing protein [Dichotomocladium elegans]